MRMHFKGGGPIDGLDWDYGVGLTPDFITRVEAEDDGMPVRVFTIAGAPYTIPEDPQAVPQPLEVCYRYLTTIEDNAGMVGVYEFTPLIAERG